MGKDKHGQGLEALKILKNRVPAAAPSRPRIVVPAAPAEPDDSANAPAPIRPGRE